MPQPKLKDVTTPNGMVHGYRPRATTRRITALPDAVISPITKRIAAGMEPADGSEPFWCDVRDDLTFAELDSVQPAAAFNDLWELIAPWVVAWNAVARDEITGEWVDVPPPAEAGPDAFKTQHTRITQFIAWCIRLGDGLTDLPKGQRRSGDTDGTPNEND
jgi:hypothetical protein